MRCYTYVHGECTKGIQTVQNDKYGRIVFLGERGRGSRFQAISLDNRRPANLYENELHRAFPREITIKDKETGKPKSQFVVLSKPFRKNRKILLRVNTTMPELQTANDGSWMALEGEPKHVVNAYGAVQQERGSIQYCDDLVIMDPTDVIRVMPMGGRQVDVRIIVVKIMTDEHNRKEPVPIAMTEEEYIEWSHEQDRIAEEEAKKSQKKEEDEVPA